MTSGRFGLSEFNPLSPQSGAAVRETRRALLFHAQGDGENPCGGSVILPGPAINESNRPAACRHDFELPTVDSRPAWRLPPWLKSIAQKRAHRPACLRHAPAKARGGVFLEADFDGLTERGFQRLAIAGFVECEDWQCLRFHARSFAETARGGNSNYWQALALHARCLTDATQVV